MPLPAIAHPSVPSERYIPTRLRCGPDESVEYRKASAMEGAKRRLTGVIGRVRDAISSLITPLRDRKSGRRAA